MKIADSTAIQTCDQRMYTQAGYPSFSLMENAARAFGKIFLEEIDPDPKQHSILILCGSGNNGGDGMGIARYLKTSGFHVEVALTKIPENTESDCGKMYTLLQLCEIRIHETLPDLHHFTILIDALYGTGISAELQGKGKDWIDTCRNTNLQIIAVDLPSGLIADSGKMYTKPLRAQLTITFHLPKYCHYIFPAAEYCGNIKIAEIGILPSITHSVALSGELADAAFFKRNFIARGKNAHKGVGGHVLICGGSKGMSGAVSLSAHAAFRAGAGKVSVFVPEGIRKDLHKKTAELMSFNPGTRNDTHLSPENIPAYLEALEKVQACLLGPGMGTHEDSQLFIEKVLPKIKTPLILDADALNIISAAPEFMKRVPENSILTPHPGEMIRLSRNENVLTERKEVALEMALQFRSVIVLKGAGTLIAAPDGKLYVCPYGNPVLSVAGSGDILGGLITAFRAGGYAPDIAACMGVILHAKAADILTELYLKKNKNRGSLFLESGELMEVLPVAIQRLLD